MAGTLKGRVAVVTGGSRGIGAAIVRRLADAGANVVFSYGRSTQDAENLATQVQLKSGSEIFPVKADQAVPSEIRSLIAKAYETFGSIDILVNNAGVLTGAAVDDTNADIEALDRLLEVNVKGVSIAVRAAAPLLKSGGRIINIGSIFADRAPLPGLADYAASKAAVAGYTRGWARDLGKKDITVNLVQPGPIDTDMNPDSVPFAETLKSFAANGKYGKAEDIAATVAFLASPEAGHITGTTINVDGGFCA